MRVIFANSSKRMHNDCFKTQTQTHKHINTQKSQIVNNRKHYYKMSFNIVKFQYNKYEISA